MFSKHGTHLSKISDFLDSRFWISGGVQLFVLRVKPHEIIPRYYQPLF